MRLTSVALVFCLLAAGCAGKEQEQSLERLSGLDRAFARNGITVAPALGLWSQTFVRLRDGKYIAVGFSRGPRGVALVRYLADGRLDRAFRRRVWPQFGAGNLGALAVAHQPDDKIVVAACQPPDCWGYVVLARFRSDGRLDHTFGRRGIVRTSIPNADLTPLAMALQPDGKILVAGDVQHVPATGGVDRSFVARYHRDGRLDREFGESGISAPGDADGIGAVLVQPDGRILVGGRSAIVRLFPNGKLDATFGVGGVAPGLSVAALLLQPDGKIVAAGSGGKPSKPVFALARLTSTGKRDPSFGVGSRLFHRRPGDHWARVETLVRVPGGRLVAAGWATRGPSVLKRHYRFVLLVLTPAGRLVPSFADGGRLTITSIEGRALAAFPVGSRRLVLVGPQADLKPRNVVFASVSLR